MAPNALPQWCGSKNANFPTVGLIMAFYSILNVGQNANFWQLSKQYEGPSVWQASICTLCNGALVRSEVRRCWKTLRTNWNKLEWGKNGLAETDALIFRSLVVLCLEKEEN